MSKNSIKTLVNAINLSSAGGMSVAKNFFENAKNHKNHTFVLIVPENCGYRQFDQYENITVNEVSKKWTNYLGRIVFDYLLIRRILTKEKPDVIFTMGNFAIPTRKYKQLLFFAWPYAVYPEAIRDLNFSFKQKVIQYLRLFAFSSRLKYASVVSPQTDIDGERLKMYYPKIGNIEVVPNAYTIVEGAKSKNEFDYLDSQQINLLCLSRYYVHKNIEILVAVAEQFKIRKLRFRIILTLERTDHVNVTDILDQIEKKKLSEYILNIGSLKLESIKGLYEKCDALILPTLLEAYSTTYADSMNLEKTIFTSDKGFSRGVCGDAAFYFDPYSAEDITNTIVQAYDHPSIIKQKRAIGKQRSESFPNWEEVSEMYVKLLEKLSNKY